MNWQLIIGSGGLVGIGAIIFYLGRIVARFEVRFDLIDKRFDLVDKKFDAIDKKFDKLDGELKEIRKEISSVGSRLDRLEVRVEERTLKIVNIQREAQEKILEHV